MGELPHCRGTEEDLGPWLDSQQLEPGPLWIPECSAQTVRRRNRFRDVRLLHREDQWDGSPQPIRLHRLRGRQRHGAGRRGGAWSAWATSGSRTFLKTRTDSSCLRSTAGAGASSQVTPACKVGPTSRSLAASSSIRRRSRSSATSSPLTFGTSRSTRGQSPAPRGSSRSRSGSCKAQAAVQHCDQEPEELLGVAQSRSGDTRSSSTAATPAPRGPQALGRGRRQDFPRPLRLRLGGDDGRDRRCPFRAGDRVLRRTCRSSTS